MDEKFRYLLRFSKNGPLRFIGHLDLLRVFQQTVRRAGLPVAYSQGYNPHQLISFALPLPLGMASEHDYVEMYFQEPIDCEIALNRFNGAAPEGLTLTMVKPFPAGPGVAACTCAADYIWQADVNGSAIDELLRRKEIIIPKKTKSGVKDTDIRPDIFHIKKEGASVAFRLAAGSQRFLNPLTAAGLLVPKVELSPERDSVKDEDPHGISPEAGPSAGKHPAWYVPDPGQFTRMELYRPGEGGKLVSLGDYA
jgi:radical SAM-linked protein